MQHLTYAALYLLLGLAALTYTAHQALRHPTTWRALSRLTHRRPRLRLVKEGHHHDTTG